MTPAPTAKRPLILAGGQITCSLSDAGRAIGAYAFATTPLKPGQMPAAVGPGPTAVERARWSAEIYDFQRPTPGPLTYNDLIANIALSSQIKEYAISGMQRRRLIRPIHPPVSAVAGFRFPPEVILLAVRWYLRYGLSYRDLEELLAERGIEVDHVTLYRWVQRFTPILVEAAKPCSHSAGSSWFVDET